jgi:hypothetical protein
MRPIVSHNRPNQHEIFAIQVGECIALDLPSAKPPILVDLPEMASLMNSHNAKHTDAVECTTATLKETLA